MLLGRLFVPVDVTLAESIGRKQQSELLKLNRQLSTTICHQRCNSIELVDAGRRPLRVSRSIEAWYKALGDD